METKIVKERESPKITEFGEQADIIVKRNAVSPLNTTIAPFGELKERGQGRGRCFRGMESCVKTRK